MKKLAIILLILATPAAAERAVTEGKAATNNAIYVSSTTGPYLVGIGTATPLATLDVAGNAQFGQGANKSTFTLTGALNLNPGQNVTVSGGGVFSGPLSGTATSATTATNLANGGAGQLPYQSASGATAFMPSMGAAGIVVGNGSGVAPSTAVLQGTANQVTVTQTGTAVTLSLPQNINSGAAPTFSGTNFTGIPESGVTNLTTDLTARVLKAGDTMTGPLNMASGVNVTVSGGGVFAGPLSGTATSATTATNLAGGGAGQLPYQSASGATAFMPSMGAAGIIVGNGSGVAPSTAVLQGTANQVTVTQTGTAVTLSLPQSINSGAAPTFAGTNFTGIPESGVTNLTTDLTARVLKAGDTMTGPLTVNAGVSVTSITVPSGFVGVSSGAVVPALGVGTGIPASGLNVLSGGSFISAATFTIAGTAPGDIVNFQRQDSAVKYFLGYASDGGMTIGSRTNHPLHVFTNGVERQTITEGGQSSFNGSLTVAGSSSMTVTGASYLAGNVGIGTTNPQYKLHVSTGGIYSDGQTPSIFIAGNTAAGKALYLTDSLGAKYNFEIGENTIVNSALTITPSAAAGGSTYTNPAIQVAGSNGNVLLVPNTGSVGIGTTSPQTTLDTNGSMQWGSGASKSTGTADGNIHINDTGGVAWGSGTSNMISGYNGGNWVRVVTNNVEAARFDGNGRLGIGTASPASTSTLHVGGATGNLSVNGKIQVGPGGITFPDGTNQTSAAAAGGGTVTTQGSPAAGYSAVFQAGTIISSGPFYATSTGTTTNLPFVFNSTAAVGPQDYTSTAATSGFAPAGVSTTSIYLNGWTVVASTNPSNSPAEVITGLGGLRKYRIHWSLIQNSAAATYTVQFNNDAGTNYGWALHSTITSATQGDGGNRAVTSITLMRSTVFAGGAAEGYIEFWARAPSGTRQMVQMDQTYDANGTGDTVIWNDHGGGYYTGSTQITSMTFSASAGNFTGYFWIEELIPVKP